MTSVSRTLRLKVSLGVSLTLLLLLAPLNWIQYEFQRRTALRELELLAAATGSFVVQSLETAMLANNRQEIQATVDNVVDTPEIQSIYILNTEGEVAASPGTAHNGEILSQDAKDCRVCHRQDVADRPRGIVTQDMTGRPIFRTMAPIVNRVECHDCHDPAAPINGVFYMDFSMIGLNARLDDARRTAFWASLAIIGICAAAIYGLLSHLMITPLERVVRGMRSFGQGRRSARVNVTTQDEVGMVAETFNEMAATIQAQEELAGELYRELEANDLARRQLLTRLITAREEEQQRLSRRIHDVLGQLLTGASLQLKFCEEAVPDDLEPVKTHLARANAVMHETIDQAHDLITELRPSVLDDYGLIPALEEEVKRRLTPLGIAGQVSRQGNVDQLTDEQTTAAFRIIQEAISNVIRHARADSVEIDLRCDSSELWITVDDDGVGLEGETAHRYRGTGISGMEERAAAVGGRVDVTPRPPHGTRVRLRIPVLEANG
jgi:signal transduction histidine kinase